MNNSNPIIVKTCVGNRQILGQIPDLWHIAEWLLSESERRDLPELENQALQILEVWHMAHDLKAAIERQEKAEIIQYTDSQTGKIVTENWVDKIRATNIEIDAAEREAENYEN